MTARVLQEKIKLVDIFSGCGGFSLGAEKAGLKVVAAIDNDPILSSSYEKNIPNSKMILADVVDLDGEAVTSMVKGPVDGIIGGPPCQGFSTIGRRDPEDPRRQLLSHYFRLIKDVQPSFFVMENVTGLAYSNARYVLNEAIRQVANYAILGPQIWNAAHFGAATNRSRLFVIGIHKDHGCRLKREDIEAYKRRPGTVEAAIGDLDGARAIGDDDGFDEWRITYRGRPTDYARTLRSADGCFTGHRKTLHSETVTTRFENLPQGNIDPVGRHPRLAWNEQSPAIRAGTGADRGSYQAVRPVHPRYPRVVTVREAARLQGFPDSYRFHPTIWHSFRMIGNSVSPFMSHAIFQAIREVLA